MWYSEGSVSEASMFCFDNAFPEKSCFVDGLVCFISLCLRVFKFLNATRRKWNLPQEREFFSVSPFASERKTDEVKEFTIAERTVKVCLLHFRLEYLGKCVTDRIYFQVGVIWLNAFTGFNDGVVEVHLLGDSTVIFSSCDSVRVKYWKR